MIHRNINVCPREELFGPDAMFDLSWDFAGHGEIWVGDCYLHPVVVGVEVVVVKAAAAAAATTTIFMQEAPLTKVVFREV